MKTITVGLISIVCVFTAASVSAETPGAEAEKLLRMTGIEGGFIVHLGSGDGRLTAALYAGGRYLVHGLDADAGNIAQAREWIDSLGLYGAVSVDRFDGPRLPYIDNVVNALVAEELGSVSVDEITRVLVPEGVALIRDGAGWRKIVKARPPELDNWTHFLHGADGNAVANDTVVDAPYHLQWVGGPRYARTHEGLSSVNVVVSDGKRIYYFADDATVALPEQLPTKWALVARDAFNGVVLWKRPLSRWQARSAGSRHRFPPDLFRRLVAGTRHVYATMSIFGPVSALDPGDGTTARVYKNTEGTEEILYDKGVLYLVVNPASPETVDRGLLASTVPLSEPKQLMAIDADTGRPLWTKNDRATTGLIPMSTAVRDGYLVFQNPRELVCLNADSGEVRWRTKRRSPETRPVWGTPTLVIADGVVLSADRRAPGAGEEDKGVQVGAKTASKQPIEDLRKSRSELIAYELGNGTRLWNIPCAEGSHVPNEVFVVDGLVWAGEQPNRSDQDYRVGRDIHTGKVERTFPSSNDWVSYHHHRCYRDKATSRFILAGRTGVELIDLIDGRILPHHWIRGICKFGVLPCNGLLYLPPNQCSCYQESLVNGFNALAPRRSSDVQAEPDKHKPRLEQGPAYGRVGKQPVPPAAAGRDWPTYRCDAARTGFTPERLPVGLQKSWLTEISECLTPPVIDRDRVYVAATDRHTVYALDVESGTTQWRYTAGGRVDSPPTVAKGLVVFGCRDGWVYALRAADGALVWRYRAAPSDQRLVAYGQCESVWPVHGSVLVEANRVYFAAGRYSHLDGGVACTVVDLETGRKIVDRRHYSRDADTGGQTSLYKPFPGALLPDRELPGVSPDVPASDGEFVFMRSVAFDREFNPADSYVRHLFAANGFTDSAWFQRLFWIYGNHLFSGLAGRSFNKGYPSVGRILVHDDDTLYGYRDYTLNEEGVFAIEKTRELGMFDSEYPLSKKDMKRRKGRSKGENSVGNRWRLDVPFYVRAMVSTGDSLLLAGPSKHDPDGAHEMIVNRPVDTDPLPPLLQTALAAWKGERGGWLWIVDKKDGAKLAEYKLQSPPVHDGMAVASERLFVSTMAGSLLCLGKAE